MVTTAAVDGRDWVVTYRSRPRAELEVWLRIMCVPRVVDRDGVAAMLEAWHEWPRWQARVRPGAVVNVRPFIASDEQRQTPGTRAVSWDNLAPARRRIQVPADGMLYAAVNLAARQAGVSMTQWVLETLAAAAGAQYVHHGRPVPGVDDDGIVDEPLPGMGGTP